MLFAQCENDSLQAYNAMTSAMQKTPIYAENTGESMFSSSSPFSWNALGVHVVCLLRDTTQRQTLFFFFTFIFGAAAENTLSISRMEITLRRYIMSVLLS